MKGPGIFISIIIIFAIGCNSGEDGKSGETTDTATAIISPADKESILISSFNSFREAMLKGDRQKVKSFFDFPITGEHNEIWFVADQDIDSTLAEEKNEKPFIEKHFEQYFARLFPEMFVRSINQVNADSLFQNGEYNTADDKIGETIFSMLASFDKKENVLYLNLATRTPVKGEGLDDFEFSEFNMIYQFAAVRDGRLKFKQINLAG
jgi:hypothetical protein